MSGAEARLLGLAGGADDGALLAEWALEQPGHAVAVDDTGQVWIGQSGQVRIYDGKGKLLDTWRPEILGLVTAIDFGKDDVFFAVAASRASSGTR